LSRLQTTRHAIAVKQTTLLAAMKSWGDAFWKRLETKEGALP